MIRRFVMCAMLGAFGGSAQAQVEGPLAELDYLTHSTWHGGGTGYSTRLAYRWLLPGRLLEATNEVRNGDGMVLARYGGMYTWDGGREEIAFWTAAESGELHRGRAWLDNGVLWHEAEVSGGQIAAYASAIRRAGDGFEYFAAYGTRRAESSLLESEPIRYEPVSATAAPDTSGVLRIDGEIEIRASRADVWAALTTPSGLAKWIAPESRVELRPGGAYELYFTPDADDRGMEGTTVMAFVPEEMLATTGEAADTWSVWRLDEVASGVTRVRFSGLGTGAEWAARAGYFRDVTPGVLERLRAAAEAGSH